MLWGALLAMAQQLAFLPTLIVSCVALGVALWAAPARSRCLLRRVRYLVLAVAVVFGWGTAGRLIIPDWPFVSPTVEGVWLAGIHCLRLVCVVSFVALLLEYTTIGEFVGGLYALARPLCVIGLDARRAALRLALTLELAAQANTRSWREWLDFECAPEIVVSLVEHRAGRADGVVLVAVAAIVFVFLAGVMGAGDGVMR